MSTQRFRAYAWEFPVRFTHWINFLCIISFTVTGLYIGYPYSHAISANQYIMGWIRFVHFTTGYVFLMSFVIRLYWAFMGNQYANWRVWFPFTPRRWKDLVGALAFYLFIRRKPPYVVGHSALAGITYFVVFLLFLFQIFSGFALYSQSQQGFIFTILGGWLAGIMNLQTIRLWHHLVMWVILAFVIVHVYIAWYLDKAEKNGLMGSIFNGYKFVTGKE
jgi:Ni/Fe-hydrogenase 1 B-type cytochrome subunit